MAVESEYFLEIIFGSALFLRNICYF